MPHTSPTQVKYAGRDFDTLVNDLEFRLKSRFGSDYSDFSTSSMGVLLIDVMSYAMTQLAWYQDRRATEGFLQTARKRSSVSRLTRPLGYQMRPATSATVALQVTPEEAQAFEWKVYAGFSFSGPEGLVFEALEDVTWAAGSTATQDVLVREGSTKIATSTSNGSENIEVRLPGLSTSDKYLIDGTVRVFVDGAQWSEVDFLDFEETDQFEVHYHEEPPIVRFGNGIAGNIPPSGAEIRIQYAVNSGKRGNVASNSITSTTGPLIQRFTEVAITVTNADGATGGTDPESIDEAKIKAPKYFATRGVAVTQQDYESLSLAFSDAQYGAVSSAFAFVARSIQADLIGDGLLGVIEQAVLDFAGDLDTRAATITASASAIDANVATISAESDSVVTQANAVIADGNSILDNVVIVEKTNAIDRVEAILAEQNGDTDGYAYDSTDLVGLLENIVSEGTSAYVTQAQAARASLLNEWIPDIQLAKDTLLPGFQSSIESAASAIRSATEDSVVQASLIIADAATIVNSNTSIGTESASIASEAASLSAEVTSRQAAIQAAADELSDHYEGILSADCKANLITVPILTVDGDGFYASPSAGLIARLQTYLQDRADVAHTVRVVDGSSALVSVSPTIEISILEEYVFAEVSSDIDTEIRNLLKSRRFGVSLYLSTIYDVIEALDGVDTFDVSLAVDEVGLPTGVGVDSRGNVIVSDEFVITLGTITIDQKP